MKVFVQEPEETNKQSNKQKNDKIKVYTNKPEEAAAQEPKTKPRKSKKLTVHGYDPVTNEIIRTIQAEAEKKKALRDDASLCKVKVKKNRKKRDATEDKQYVIKGKDKSVVLEFKRMFGGKEGKGKSSKKKQLGKSIGRAELKEQAMKQKMEKMEMGDTDNLEDAEEAEDEGELGDEEDNDDEDAVDGDNEAGWFRLEKLTNKDYSEFLTSVKCNVYSTPANCNNFNNCNNMKTDRCSNPKAMQCGNDENVEGEDTEDDDDTLYADDNEDEDEVEEREFEDDLKELQEFRAQQERMEQLERQQMEALRAEEESIRRINDEASAIQREAAELRRMQQEEEMRRLQQEAEDYRRRREQEEEEDYLRRQQEEEAYRRRRKREEKAFRKRHQEEEEEMRRVLEEEFRRRQEEEDEYRRIQKEKEELQRRQKEEQMMRVKEESELRIIEMQRQEIQRLQKEREELLEKGQLDEEERKVVFEDVKQKTTRKKESHRTRNRRSRRSKHSRSGYDSESSEEDEKGWLSKAFSVFTCGENMEFLDLCDTPGPEEHVPVPVKKHANQHQTSPPTALYAAIGTQNWSIALRRLMDKPEEAAQKVTNASTDGKSVYNFFPLHVACISGAPLLLITMLVQAFPQAVQITAMGKLPIHMACEAQADHRVVFLLINSWPESLNEIDDDSKTPIEIASEGEGSPERRKIIQMLTKKMENTVVRTPTVLYSAIDAQNWNKAMIRLVDMPQEATTWVSYSKDNMEYRFLPLHAACLVGAPLLLISDLISAYPDAVRKKTTQGKLPIHIACEVHADERVVKLLLESWPESLYLKDTSGNSPEEIVANADFSPERSAILRLLEDKLQNNDAIVFSPTKLYQLIEANLWDDAVRRSLECPEEVSTWVGSCQKILDARLLPLHVACASRAPLLLIAVLIQNYPDSVKKTNNSGKLPIHLACEKRTDHRVIAFLLHTWPESATFKDEKGNTPVQTALISKVSDERTKIVETLMDHEGESEEEYEDALAVEMEAKELLAQERMDDDIDDDADIREMKNLKNELQTKSKKTKRKRKNKKDKHTLWAPSEDMFQQY